MLNTDILSLLNNPGIDQQHLLAEKGLAISQYVWFHTEFIDIHWKGFVYQTTRENAVKKEFVHIYNSGWFSFWFWLFLCIQPDSKSRKHTLFSFPKWLTDPKDDTFTHLPKTNIDVNDSSQNGINTSKQNHLKTKRSWPSKTTGAAAMCKKAFTIHFISPSRTISLFYLCLTASYIWKSDVCV